MVPAPAASTSQLSPDARVDRLSGVGTGQTQRLERLGITTVRQLLEHLPRRYEDSSQVVPLTALRPGEEQTVRVRITDVRSRPARMGSLVLVEALLEGDGVTASAIWFNQTFLLRQLPTDADVLLYGKVGYSNGRMQMRNPTWERFGEVQREVGRLVPLYPETAGVSSRWLRAHIEPLLSHIEHWEDTLPPQVLREQHLPWYADALRQVHFPKTLAQAGLARERIAFEELFLLQLAAQRARRRRLAADGVVIPYDVEVARSFVSGLPFSLTPGQRRSAHEILRDLEGRGPMNRLLQGDVGSGKTVVGAMAARMAHAAHLQSAVMAPTELLARQHQATLQHLLAPHGVSVRLLVGSTPQRARREILDGIAGGLDDVLVGTHALIEDEVRFDALGLVIVDEQHRFGVAQRQRLRQKAERMPNFLAMTATPIPRSLALTAYGDVDLSEIRELPPQRRAILTEIVSPLERAEAYDFVRKQIAQGRQVFVICPLIEESDRLGVRSATTEYERLSTAVFPDLRIELLHGRLPARDKEERMARFVSGATDLLVTTSVVEVGVDIPNASVMLIEGAERFGLAQLHQFRGRVGRSEHASYCLLFQTHIDEEGSQRLRAMADTQSGFDLAELDLRLRGPGEVAGLRQHGLPEMRAADLLDEAMLARARDAAARWLLLDPEFTSHAPLREAMSGYRAVFDLD